MATRVDQAFTDDLNDLPAYRSDASFTGLMSRDRVAMEQEALNLRLRGVKAYVQNGLDGHYEVMAVSREQSLRVFNAKDFKAVGAGVYVAAQPEWDAGSVWAVHSNEADGSILLSRVDDEDVPTLDGEMVQASSIGNLARAANRVYKAGESITYVDPLNNVVTGKVMEVDHHAAGYWVQSPITASPDFVSMDTAVGDIDDDETAELLALKDIEDDLDDLIDDHEEIVLD